MNSAKDVVTSYQKAMGNDDWTAMRSHLRDDLEFSGPIDTFHTADEYLGALQRLNPLVEGVDIKRVFAEGTDVVVLCDLHFKPPMPKTMYVVEWYTVTGDKISRLQVVFDSRPMPPMPGGPAAR